MDVEDLPTEEIIRRFVSQPSKWHEPQAGVYHASSVWYCLRRNYYKETGVPEERPLPHGLFEMGRRAEDVVFDALKAHYGERFVLNSVPVRWEADGFMVVGETDPVLIDWVLFVKRVYEVKSSEVRDKKKRNPTEDRHRHQASFYAGQLSTPAGDVMETMNQPEVHIVHPGRSDVLNFRETVLDPADVDTYYKETLAYFEQLHAALTAKELPPAEPKDKRECGWCPHKAKCLKDGGWTNAGGKWVRLSGIKEVP